MKSRDKRRRAKARKAKAAPPTPQAITELRKDKAMKILSGELDCKKNRLGQCDEPKDCATCSNLMC